MKSQWSDYQTLELVPESAPSPDPGKFIFLAPLSALWKGLVTALAWEHFYENRTDYLERCWQTDYAEPYAAKPTLRLRQILRLLD